VSLRFTFSSPQSQSSQRLSSVLNMRLQSQISSKLPSYLGKSWLYKIIVQPGKFRLLFLVASILGVFLDFKYSRGSLTSVYIFILMVAAFAFRNVLILFAVSFIFTMVRYLLSPFGFLPMDVVTFNFLGYFCMTFAISELLKRYIAMNKGFITFIQTVILAVDARDAYTAFHSINVAHYAQMIARKMGLSHRQCSDIYFGGLAHDIGKIGIPDSILTKPSRLRIRQSGFRDSK
jgi:HD-GYP domain-containing protein (c-di-GMP phosphodiesterase class II)